MVWYRMVSNGVEWCGVKWCQVSVMTLESLLITEKNHDKSSKTFSFSAIHSEMQNYYF